MRSCLFFICVTSVSGVISTQESSPVPNLNPTLQVTALKPQSRPSAKASGINCPTHLCIDYGSSGAKVLDCGRPMAPRKMGDKFLSGANSFKRMANMDRDQFLLTLETYMRSIGMDRTCKKETRLRMCGGTAGNRFQELNNDDASGWEQFNFGLQKYVNRAGNTCQTFPGTMEANWEWAITNKGEGQADIYAGIGGASMQVRIPTSDKCPRDVIASFMAGGQGANKWSDFCQRSDTDNDMPGQLWSFLSDATTSPKRASDQELIGGADQSVAKFGDKVLEALKSSGGLQVTDSTLLKFQTDGMWNAMLDLLHPNDQCTDLTPYRISLISNAANGLGPNYDKLMAASFLQTGSEDSYQMQSQMVASLQLQFFEMAKGHEFEGVLEQINKQCEAAKNQPGRQIFDEFGMKEDGSGPTDAFMCTINIFTATWASTFAGLATTNGKETGCFRNNWHALINSEKTSGVDWMTGYLKILCDEEPELCN